MYILMFEKVSDFSKTMFNVRLETHNGSVLRNLTLENSDNLSVIRVDFACVFSSDWVGDVQ